MNFVSRLMPLVALFCVACSNNTGGGGAGGPLVVTHDVEGSHFVSLPIHSHYAVIYEDGVHQLGNEEDDNVGGEIVLGSQEDGMQTVRLFADVKDVPVSNQPYVGTIIGFEDPLPFILNDPEDVNPMSYTPIGTATLFVRQKADGSTYHTIDFEI